MSVLSRTLERVRDSFQRRTPGRHARPATPPVVPPAPRRRPTPDVYGARLVVARGHREEKHIPPVQPRAPWEYTANLVRPYVASLGEAPRTARAGVQADPWGDAR